MRGGNGAVARKNNIVDFDNSIRLREAVEEKLRAEIELQYGEMSDSILENPVIRIFAAFEALQEDSKYLLLMYTQKLVMDDEDFNIRERFWHLLEKGRKDGDIWKKIDKYAASLLIKELK